MKSVYISVKLVLHHIWLKTTTSTYAASHLMPHLIDLAYRLTQSRNQMKTKNHQRLSNANVNIRALSVRLAGLHKAHAPTWPHHIPFSLPIQTNPRGATLMPQSTSSITSTLRSTMDSPSLPMRRYPCTPTCPFLIGQTQKHTWTLFLLLPRTTTI